MSFDPSKQLDRFRPAVLAVAVVTTALALTGCQAIDQGVAGAGGGLKLFSQSSEKSDDRGSAFADNIPDAAEVGLARE